MSIEEKVARTLTKKRKTLSIAESCTGGLLSNRLTNIPGSSRFFKLGLIVYANSAKIKLLKVSLRTIRKYGAVSLQVALAMATGARKIFNSDFGIGITGIAGPTGATKNKPAGLVYIAVSTKSKTVAFKFLFKGKRTTIKSLAATKALELLLEFIIS